MRRRLWWQICILDVRTAEDSGTDPSIFEHTFNTKFPSNVNDSDLDPGMSEPPIESQSRTEMLFSLTRFEISFAIRKVVFSEKFSHDNSYPVMTLTQKNEYIEQLGQRLQDKYLRYCDMKIPFCFVTASANRLILSKMKMMIRHPLQQLDSSLANEDLFVTSMEIIEQAHSLKSDKSSQKWVWLFQTYVGWDTLAYLLRCLCSRITGDTVARAWRVVDMAFDEWQVDPQDAQRERKWQRIEFLKEKALAAFKGALPGQNQQAHVQAIPDHFETQNWGSTDGKAAPSSRVCQAGNPNRQSVADPSLQLPDVDLATMFDMGKQNRRQVPGPNQCDLTYSTPVGTEEASDVMFTGEFMPEHLLDQASDFATWDLYNQGSLTGVDGGVFTCWL